MSAKRQIRNTQNTRSNHRGNDPAGPASRTHESRKPSDKVNPFTLGASVGKELSESFKKRLR